MKKIYNISIVAVTIMLLSLNVSFNINGDKLTDLRVNSEVQIAQAGGTCRWCEDCGKCTTDGTGSECVGGACDEVVAQ